MTNIEVAKVVAVLIAAFPGNKATDATVQIYERMLADLDGRVAAAAVERLLATSRFMPTIAEIREAAHELSRGPRRHGGEAWGDVLDAVGRFGRYRVPEFADPVVARAVDAFGWLNICDSVNQIADRARFVELYDKLTSDGRRDAVAGQLPAAKSYRARIADGDGDPFGVALANITRPL